jgi:ATP-binding cassette subfamily B protein
MTFAIGSAVAFAVGGWLYLSGAITLGTVFMLFYYTQLLQEPIERLRAELEDMQQAFASIARVDELQRIESRLPPGNGAALSRGALDVELDHVAFAYDAEPVLSDVSVHVAPGRVLGILGRTGSGKTTIARLLMRFYDPTQGAVR